MVNAAAFSSHFTFERTFDYALVRWIITHPKVYRTSLLADCYPRREDWTPVESQSIWYVIALDAGGALGVFVFVPQSEICCEAHLAMLPRAWGASVNYSLRCIDWLRATTKWRRLTALIPAYNRLAIRLVKHTGFELLAIRPAATMQNGRPVDQLLFERNI